MEFGTWHELGAVPGLHRLFCWPGHVVWRNVTLAFAWRLHLECVVLYDRKYHVQAEEEFDIHAAVTF